MACSSLEAQRPGNCLIEAHYLSMEYIVVIVLVSDFLKLDVLLASQEEAGARLDQTRLICSYVIYSWYNKDNNSFPCFSDAG